MAYEIKEMTAEEYAAWMAERKAAGRAYCQECGEFYVRGRGHGCGHNDG